MKKTFSLIALLGVAAMATAQTNLDSNQRVSVSFAQMSFEDLEGTDVGIQVSYLYSFRFTAEHDMPFYIQFGPELNWVGDSYDSARETIVNLATPLNLAMRIKLSDNINIEPFVGFNLRLNLVGKVSYQGNDVMDFFDSADARRFQAGFNAGGGININNLYFGYRYNHDLMTYIPMVSNKPSFHFITVGYNF